MVSLRRSFGWSLVGGLGYNLTQWLLVVALARWGTTTMVGQFALAQALSAPVFLTVGLNLRAVRATDVRRRWSAKQYRQLRTLLNGVSIFLVCAIALLIGLRGTALVVVLVLSLAKSAEATSQMVYGFFQIRSRLDLVSRSFLLRAALGAAGFLAGLWATGALPQACVGMVVGWTIVYLAHDRPQERRLLESDGPPPLASGDRRSRSKATLASLAWKAAPLGADAGAGSLANNMPRYAVQSQLGTAQVGAYAALAYLGQVATMATGALGDAMIGRLAIQAERRDARAFTRSMVILLSFGAVMSGLAVAGAWLIGDPVIRVLLGAEYVNQPLLIWLMVGACTTTFQRGMGRGLQALHRYSWVLIVDVVTLMITAVTVPLLVKQFGLPGAAAGVAIAFATGAVVSSCMVGYVVRSMRAAPPALPTTMSS